MGLKGSCLCGEISYEIDSVDMPIVHCHCKTCRKAHAAPFASTAGVKRENFRWLSGGRHKLYFYVRIISWQIAPLLQTLWFSFGCREACTATRNCSGSHSGR